MQIIFLVAIFRPLSAQDNSHWSELLSRHVDEDGLVEALNNFQGVLAVFDGHGSHAPGQPGLLHLMDNPIDVWQLRNRVLRPPPIVVLSACDTHAADRNHATAGNGFLSLGSRAVLSTVFPIEHLP